jgi:drug/metabolite transporter superfamily protein YnfA
MTLRTQQVLLVILGLSAALVGGWASIASRSFYNSFPGAGHHWVSMDGPYNQHLVRDVGGLYLSLLVVTVCALRHASLGRLAGGAWLIFSILHLAYHAAHLSMYSTADKIGNIVALGGTALIAAALLVAGRSLGKESI